jgi:hypothetical protein
VSIAWQPEGANHFPTIIILSEQRFAIEKKYPFRIKQAPSFGNLLRSLTPNVDSNQPNQINREYGIKIKTH